MKIDRVRGVFRAAESCMVKILAGRNYYDGGVIADDFFASRSNIKDSVPTQP